MVRHGPRYTKDRLWPLLRATHFDASVAVTAIATVLAWRAGRGAETIVVSAAVLAGQFSIGWSNDWLDAGRDRRIGRFDKPLVAGSLRLATVRNAAVGSLLISVALSLVADPASGAAHVVAVALAWGYNLGLKGTPASVACYAGAFGLLPAFAVGVVWPPAWLSASGALLGAGAHFINTLADVEGDARTGVRGLPQRIGPRASLLVGALLLGAGAVLAAAAAGSALFASALAILALGLVAAVAWCALTGRVRLAFRLTIAAAVVAAAALILGSANLG